MAVSLTETAMRLSTSSDRSHIIPMTSFDDERPSLDFAERLLKQDQVELHPVDATKFPAASSADMSELGLTLVDPEPAATAASGRSRHNSLARSRHNSYLPPVPTTDRDVYEQLPEERREYHTGFFLFNLILRLWDEYQHASASGNTLIELKTSFKPSLQRFRHMTAATKVNVGICMTVFSFVLYILQISIPAKIVLATGLGLLLTVPILSQFFFYGAPVLAWVFLFFSVPQIPQAWKPPISVKVLPAMETIMYGDNLSDILAASHNTFLDVMAWLPYGLIHFAGPFIVAALVWLFGPPTALRSLGFAYGYMNLVGVIIQQVAPSAPPWYKNLYGLKAAHYGMSGSPGGLGRIDDLLGFDMYTTAFSTSPVIFGALPSLHSGCSTMNALWLSYLFPKYRALFVGYVFWLWWSTMYLTHHYFFDLTFGTALSVTFFYLVKMTSLPLNKPEKWCRFNYRHLEYYDVEEDDPLAEEISEQTPGVEEVDFDMLESPQIGV